MADSGGDWGLTAGRRILDFLTGFVIFLGSGGNNDNPTFLGLSGTGLSDMMNKGKVFRILPRELIFNKYQVRTWAVGFAGPDGQEPSYTSSLACRALFPVPQQQAPAEAIVATHLIAIARGELFIDLAC